MALDSKTLVRRALGGALLTIAGYYAIWGGEYSAFDLLRLERHQRSEAKLLAAARQQADSLELVVDRLENDPATIEAVARERFGMLRAGEILYRFVEVDSSSAPAPK